MEYKQFPNKKGGPFSFEEDDDVNYIKGLLNEETSGLNKTCSEIEKENRTPKVEEIDYEDVTDEETDHQKLVNMSPNSIEDKILKGSTMKKAQKELAKNPPTSAQKREMSNAFNAIFESLNNEYGLDIHYDYDSLANSISNILNPKNQKAMEIYLSAAYSKFRVVIYQQFLQTIAMLSQKILDPDYLLSDSLSFGDKILVMQQLFTFLQKVEEIYEHVRQENGDLQLEKISEESSDVKVVSINDSSNKMMLDFIADEMKRRAAKEKEEQEAAKEAEAKSYMSAVEE